MRWLVRSLVIVSIGLAAAPAQARRGGVVVFNSGEEIIHIRDLSPELAAESGLPSIGYKYSLIGLFWLDLWRWDGEFVVYGPAPTGTPSAAVWGHGAALSNATTSYAPLTNEDLEVLGGASVPWKYHFPPGLLVILAAIEFLIITKSRRRVKVVLVIGAALIAFSLLLYLKGVDAAFAIPACLGLHHVIVSVFAMRQSPQPEHVPDPEPAAAAPSRPRSSQPMPARSAPTADPAPDQAPRPSQPLVVTRPTTASAETPVVVDPKAEAPKLLR